MRKTGGQDSSAEKRECRNGHMKEVNKIMRALRGCVGLSFSFLFLQKYKGHQIKLGGIKLKANKKELILHATGIDLLTSSPRKTASAKTLHRLKGKVEKDLGERFTRGY